MKNRKTIGVIVDFFTDKYQNKIWKSIVAQSKKYNYNLVCFSGGPLKAPIKQQRVRNYIFDLVNIDDFDGFIIFTSTVCNYITDKEENRFIKKFSVKPTVSIGRSFKNIPGIIIDNQTGMYEILEHLIEVHNFRKIAFIKGPEGNKEAELRYKIYLDVLKEYHIQFNKDLIVQGDFYYGSGSKAVSTLLDRKEVKFDAVIASNDIMAIDAVKEFKKRNINVPNDIAVVGFDDIEESKLIKPSLTTVSQPMLEIGITAVNKIESLLNNQKVNEDIILPTKLIIRKSCGCFSFKNVLIKHNYDNVLLKIDSKEELYSIIDDIYSDIIKELKNKFLFFKLNTDQDKWLKKLISALFDDLKKFNNESFLQTLLSIINKSISDGINILYWHYIIIILFNVVKQYIYDEKDINFLNSLLNFTFTVIWENETDVQIDKRLITEDILMQLHRITVRLSNTFEENQIKKIILNEFPLLGFNCCYINEFLDNNREYSKTFINYNSVKNNREKSNKNFRSKNFLSNMTHDSDNGFVYVVMALYFKYVNPLGFTVFNYNPMLGIVYETMLTQLSSVIKGAYLLKQEKILTHDLEKKVIARTADLKDAYDKLKTTNNKIRDLYRELDYKSKIDSLTNVYNREALYSFLSIEIKKTKRKKSRFKNIENKKLAREELENNIKKAVKHIGTFSIIILDIDHFKTINDTYGHLAGDKVLRYLGNLCNNKNIIREEDIAGRFGGEEFIIILPNTNAENSFFVAKRLNDMLMNKKFKYNNEEFSVTLSAGITEFNIGDDNKDDIIHRADKALYYAKDHGRNKIVIYEEIFK